MNEPFISALDASHRDEYFGRRFRLNGDRNAAIATLRTWQQLLSRLALRVRHRSG
jgi:hypothetical protein